MTVFCTLSNSKVHFNAARLSARSLSFDACKARDPGHMDFKQWSRELINVMQSFYWLCFLMRLLSEGN